MNQTQAGGTSQSIKAVGEPVSASSDGRLVTALLDAGAALSAKLVIADHQGLIRDVRGISPRVVHEVNSGTATEGLSCAISRVITQALQGFRADQTLVLQGPPKRSLVLFGLPYRAHDDSIDGAVVLIWDTTEQRFIDTLTVDFLSSLAHELKSPLASISILSDALATGGLNDDQRDLLEKLHAEVKRATRLVDSLHAMTRAEAEDALDFETVNATEIINDCVERVAVLAESHEVDIQIDCAENANVYGNARELTSALCHLVENAVQLSDPGSKVIIKAEADPLITRISVTDFGMGISKADQERIFERFVRLDSASRKRAGGSGLGLSIVKRVVFANGGEVKVQSEPGKGSSFTLLLAGFEPILDQTRAPIIQGGHET